MSEANLFAEKDGYIAHFKITVEDGPEGLPKLMKNTEIFIDWMKANDYKHDSSKDRGGRGGGGKPPRPAPMVNGVEVRCGQCGGPVWDNREENKKRASNGERLRPEFACKKKDECGWVKWPSRDEEYEEALPFE